MPDLKPGLTAITVWLESDVYADLLRVAYITKVSEVEMVKLLMTDQLKVIKVLSENFTKQINIKIKE